MNDGKATLHNGDLYHDHDHDHDHYDDHDEDHCPHHHYHCHHDDDDDELDSADEASPVAIRHAGSYRSPPRSPRSARHARYGSHGGRGSVSADGYEAFENTNNKKKRKIPTSGSMSMHHGSITAEMAQLGIGANMDGHAESVIAGPSNIGSSGLGVQGAGRGHYARKSSARRPLGVSMNGSNARSGTAKYDQNMAATAKAEDSKDQGIISAAIANATALLRKPLGKGQENVGVLDEQAKQAPANSQFTFTCESDTKGVQFPERSLHNQNYAQRSGRLPPPGSPAAQRGTTQGTQTGHIPQGQGVQQTPPPAANPNAHGKKPRRRRGDLYALAARQRKLQQEYSNIQHPPSREDIWICEFCEYESIFGEPPHALIRQYEIKDRKERRRLAEKRRLLEKAKLKGRKGKKQTKAAKASNNAAQQPMDPQDYDDQPLDQLADDDLDYGYDDDPVPLTAPPPAPMMQPMPGTYDPSSKGGGPDTGGGI